jgi:PAS domain S-box-containing protein
MDEKKGTSEVPKGQTAPSGVGAATPDSSGAVDIVKLRYAAADFLRDSKERMATEIDRRLESTLSGYKDLPPGVLNDIRVSFREFLQLYQDYVQAGELQVKYVRSLATDVGKRRAAQGIELSASVDAYDEGEAYVWEQITAGLAERGFSTEGWLELGRMRDRINRMVRHYISRAYSREEKVVADKQVDEFRALSSLGQTIVSTMDLEKVLGQVLEVATTLMETKLGAIMLLDETQKNVQPVVDMGLSKAWVQREKIALRESLAGVAIKRNDYVLAQDDELSSFELPRAGAGRKIRSALSVPITTEGGPIGAIELYDTVPRTYSDLDITMLMTFGSQAGVAIKNARLFAAEKRRRRQASTLTLMAEAISMTRDLDGLLETVTEKMAVALGVDRCSLYFYDQEANALTFMAGYGRSTLQVWLLNQFHMPMNELGKSTAEAIRLKEPVVVEEAGDELSLEYRIFRGPGVKTYMQVPLVVKDELIGLVSLEHTSVEKRFSDDDAELANALGRQSAIAIQNRKLQEKLFEQQLAIKNAEVNERLYRERERSEAVLNVTPDAVFVIDRNMKVILVNPAAEFLTGWGMEDAVGRGCHEVLYGSEAAPGKCPGPDCAINRVFSGERVAYAEDTIVSKTGRRIPAGGSFAPIYGSGGKVENVVAIYRDISEQKELEKYALMQREMDIASGIQSSLLPRDRLLAGGVSIVASQKQARIVGGDWYDYWSYGDKIFIVIGDASGSGVGAALFATMAMSALRVEAREHTNIQEILEHVNRNLFLANQTESFVTVFLGVLDLSDMTLSYSNAGHEDPIWISDDGKEQDMLASSNRSLLGIFSRANLDLQRHVVKAGERLVLYTDGVIDVQNNRGKFYGLKRLNRFVASHRELPGEQFIDALINDLGQFAEREAKDDITVMVCDLA